MAQEQTDKPAKGETHVRPMDDPARGQGDKLEDKLPHRESGEANRPPGPGPRKEKGSEGR
jgi:hypothetical protein